MDNIISNSFVNGAISGCLSTIILQPLDVIKTRRQLSVLNIEQQLSNVLTVKCLYNKYGILGFWKGGIPSLMRTIPGVGSYMMFISIYDSYLPQNTELFNRSLVIGILSRGSATLALMPMSVLKTQIESHIYKKSSLKESISRIYQTLGYKGFYSGSLSTLMRDAPYSGVFLMCFSKSKEILSEMTETPQSQLGLIHLLAASLTGSIFSSLITQPADVMKTYRQVVVTQRPDPMSTMINNIYKTSGISGFFRGSILRIFRKFITSSVTWINYHYFVMNSSRR